MKLSWKIGSIKTTKVGTVENVISKIYWTLVATEKKATAEFNDVTIFNIDKVDDTHVNFADLTQAMVEGWLMEDVKANKPQILEILQAQLKTKESDAVAPWIVPEAPVQPIETTESVPGSSPADAQVAE